MKTLRASAFFAAVATVAVAAALDFADQQLHGIDHHRSFGQFPAGHTSTNSITLK